MLSSKPSSPPAELTVDAGTAPPAVPASADASLPGNGRWYGIAAASVVVAVVAGVMIGPHSMGKRGDMTTICCARPLSRTTDLGIFAYQPARPAAAAT